MFVLIVTITALLPVIVGGRLRKAHGQFKQRIDRGYPIVRDSSQVEAGLEIRTLERLQAQAPDHSYQILR